MYDTKTNGRLRSPFERISPFGPIVDMIIFIGVVLAFSGAVAWMVVP